VFAKISQQQASNNVLLSQSQPWALLGVFCGFFLWIFGIWWMVLSIIAIYETFRSDRPTFAVGFWGMVFPLVSIYTNLLTASSDLGSKNRGSTHFSPFSLRKRLTRAFSALFRRSSALVCLRCGQHLLWSHSMRFSSTGGGCLTPHA
jgi:hypothetical protein